MEDFADWLHENWHNVGLGVCAVGAAIFMGTGHGDAWKQSAEKDAIKGVTNTLEQKAEEVYFREDGSRGCSAQVLSETTRTTGIKDGEPVIDPLTVTEQNPKGSRFNGGFVCGSDGSVFSVNQDGTIKLIGSSNKVRDDLVKTGAIARAVEMEQYARTIYDRSRQNQGTTNPEAPAAINPIVTPPSTPVVAPPVAPPYETTTTRLAPN